MNAIPAEVTFYDEVGGEPTFRALVAAFYRGVAADERLRPMYPEAELGPAEDRLRLFLIQYWGGPSTYSQERGHPRLRMRHVPYAVTPGARDAWLEHMLGAVSQLELTDRQRQRLTDYFVMAADSLINTPE